MKWLVTKEDTTSIVREDSSKMMSQLPPPCSDLSSTSTMEASVEVSGSATASTASASLVSSKSDGSDQGDEEPSVVVSGSATASTASASLVSSESDGSDQGDEEQAEDFVRGMSPRLDLPDPNVVAARLQVIHVAVKTSYRG